MQNFALKKNKIPVIMFGIVALLLAASGCLGWSYYKKIGLFTPTALYDFELLAAKEGIGSELYLARYKKGIKADTMLISAKAHCNERARQLDKFESCAIVVVRSDVAFEDPAISGPLTNRNLGNIMNVLAQEWGDSGTVDGLFILDPDNSEVRHRPDEIFVVDCAIFDEPVQSETIICKGSDRDSLSIEMRRATSRG